MSIYRFLQLINRKTAEAICHALDQEALPDEKRAADELLKGVVIKGKSLLPKKEQVETKRPGPRKASTINSTDEALRHLIGIMAEVLEIKSSSRMNTLNSVLVTLKRFTGWAESYVFFTREELHWIHWNAEKAIESKYEIVRAVGAAFKKLISSASPKLPDICERSPSFMEIKPREGCHKEQKEDSNYYDRLLLILRFEPDQTKATAERRGKTNQANLSPDHKQVGLGRKEVLNMALGRLLHARQLLSFVDYGVAHDALLEAHRFTNHQGIFHLPITAGTEALSLVSTLQKACIRQGIHPFQTAVSPDGWGTEELPWYITSGGGYWDLTRSIRCK